MKTSGFTSLQDLEAPEELASSAPSTEPAFAFVGVFEDLIGSAFLMQRAFGWESDSLRAAFSSPSTSSAPTRELLKEHANEKLNPKTRCTIEASESR